MIKKILENSEWKKLDILGESLTSGRFGHISAAYKSGFIIHGGEKEFNKALKVRDCLNDVRYFNIESKEWKFLKSWGDFSESRAYHTANLISKLLIIYGGINNNCRILKDIMFLNLGLIYSII